MIIHVQQYSCYIYHIQFDSFNEHLEVDVLYTYFKKAFDCVENNLLTIALAK